MNNFEENKKIDILLVGLKERYKSIHTIRKRLQDIGIWVLGILITGSAWLYQTDIKLFFDEQFFLIALLIIVVAVLFETYIKDLEKGFTEQLKVAARIETILGFYESKLLDEKGGGSVYPLEWKMAGTDKGEGKYFKTTQSLIILGMAVLFLAILSKGCIGFDFSILLI